MLASLELMMHYPLNLKTINAFCQDIIFDLGPWPNMMKRKENYIVYT